MNGESLERLMEIILQMKINLTHINETLHQQTYEIRRELGSVFEEQKHALERCLDSIDHQLEKCCAHIEEYQRLYSNLSAMREKLIQLGGEPSGLPTGSAGPDLESVIAWRLKELKEHGRL